MKVDDRICADIELRLVDGQRPADDAALAAHVRSCLRCFRAAADLREVPHIAALLRDMAEPDPGDLFWARFPTAVADAWEKRRAPRPAVWQRLGRWFQLPIPAALTGAAVAAGLVVLITHRAPVVPVPAPVAAMATTPAADPLPLLDEEAPALMGDDDPLEALDLADAKVAAHVAVENAPAAGDDGNEGELSAVDEVEQLDGDELTAVAQALRARSQI